PWFDVWHATCDALLSSTTTATSSGGHVETFLSAYPPLPGETTSGIAHGTEPIAKTNSPVTTPIPTTSTNLPIPTPPTTPTTPVTPTGNRTSRASPTISGSAVITTGAVAGAAAGAAIEYVAGVGAAALALAAIAV
ncbi:hypothetical protein Plec18167_009243, partial [Paecilomyces lecythidis]